MKTTLLAMMLAGTAFGQTVVYQNDFTGVEGDTGETFNAALQIEFVGNGDEGGGFWDFASTALAVQAYGSRQVEIGIGSFPLQGVTLEAGTEYTIVARTDEDQNQWSNSQNVFFGLNDNANRPTTPAPFADYTTDFAFNDLELDLNNDFVPGPFNRVTWTFTPAATLVNPLFVWGTQADDISIFLDARIRLHELTITSGGGGGTLPGCNVADIAEPYGILALADIGAYVSSITGGWP